MSLSRQTLKRLPTIKHGLLKGLNREQIGGRCGVTEKTIDRDVNAWVESGEFDVWIREEFLRLHYQMIHDDPVEAYRQITKLVGKSITRRFESYQQVTERIEQTVKVDATEDEDQILSKAAAILTRKRRSAALH